MRIVRDGYPFILLPLALALLVYLAWGLYWAVIPLVVAAYFAYFFRNPERQIQTDPAVLYSPADGTVMAVEDFYDSEYLNQAATKIIIFMSVFNVHVNRSPMAGEIKYQSYVCGQFVPANEEQASLVNERHALGIAGSRVNILVIQVAGILARRIVSWRTLGNRLEQGELYGMIKFGSSLEIVVPKSVTVCVKKGDSTVGGRTVIGRLQDEL